MIRQAIADPWLAKLAVEGRLALGRLKKNEWPGLDLRSNGSLLLAKKIVARGRAPLHSIQKNLNRLDVRSVFVSKKEATKRVPLLEDGDFDEALFCPSDAFLNTRALLRAFARNLKKRSVSILLGMPLESLRKENKGFRLVAGGKMFFCKKLINASGAWAAPLAEKSGASKISLTAYRRHLFWSRTFGAVSKKWPFVWHVNRGFYFRPDQGGLMISPCDKTSCGKSDRGSWIAENRIVDRGSWIAENRIVDRGSWIARGEGTDPMMEKILAEKLKQFSKKFKEIQFYDSKAGLRTMTPDGRFVVGEDPKLKNFYWVAGLGGHGITTCFSVGKLASDIIIGNAIDRKLENALSPGRFVDH